MGAALTLAEMLRAGSKIKGLTADSRAVRKGFAFFAVPGTKADGLAFVPQAIKAGAAVIVAERRPERLPARVEFVQVKNARAALSKAASVFHFGQPALTVAITGTSGKTSTSVFCRQLWAATGIPAASLGTIGIVKPGGAVYGSLTTPDPVSLHAALAGLADEGITHLAMEASSHGLEQFRLDGVKLKAGAFLNLSRDHLDYHVTMQSYFHAKMRLFSDLLPKGAPAVIAADGRWRDAALAVAGASKLHAVTVGRGACHLRLAALKRAAGGQDLSLEFDGARFKAWLPLVGDFQVWNALSAAALCIATGSKPGRIFEAFETLQGVPGRLETAGIFKGVPVIVDYAHKPEAIVNALKALRPFAKNRLIIVFGAGGDRDAGKRPLMGKAAMDHADMVIVTDDNPRSEEPAAIRKAILAASKGAREIGDRRSAIHAAMTAARAGDIVLIAGKGHETGQIIQGKTLPFSDHAVVRDVIAEPGA